MNQLIIAPSVLSMDYSRMKEQVEALNASEAKYLHFDVMDGHFVPNLTFGPDILKGFRKMTDRILDVHLMVSDPAYYAPIFIAAGADIITFHVEALDMDLTKIKDLIETIHMAGKKGGVVIKPNTDVKWMEPLLSQLDMVLIMTVEPGFGGQAFMPDMLSKVKWLARQRDALHLNYRIEADGGIDSKTAALCIDSGCDTLVAGSYVFSGNIQERVSSLLK